MFLNLGIHSIGAVHNRSIEEETYLYHTINGSSDANEYIPLYSLFLHKGVYSHNEKKILNYGIPYIDSPSVVRNRNLKRYSDLISTLSYGGYPREFRTSSMDFSLYSMKGLLYEEFPNALKKYKILMLLAVKSESVYKQPILEPSTFTLFLDKDFTLNEKYNSIYKKLSKDLFSINPLFKVDIITTSNIEQWCYKNNLTLPKFNTLNERENHLEILKDLIYE